MKPYIAIASVVAAVLAGPAGASAAALSAQPAKPCYRGGIARVDPPGPAKPKAQDPNGESVQLVGSAFTPLLPSGGVLITRKGSEVGSAGTDDAGAFTGVLDLFQARGEGDRVYVATERANTAVTAFTRIRVSAVHVAIAGNRTATGRRLPVRARGFTTGRTLYMHVTRGRSVRNVRIGSLRYACHSLFTKKVLFPARTQPGTYRLQFDTQRAYSSKTPVRVRYRLRIYTERRPSAAAATALRQIR